MTAERMTAADYNASMTGAPANRGRNKFNARKMTVDGITFDSERERKRYMHLCLLARAGRIRDLKLQVPIMLEGQKGPVTETRKETT